MRRARWIFAWNVLALLSASAAFAASQSVNFINGVGLIDYTSHPVLKPGAWVKYHVTGASQMGSKDDYDVTVLIPGEERFWGEDCFWVETWTEQKGKPPMAVATLISYDVFTDSLPTIRSQYYLRKSIDGMTPDGSLQESFPATVEEIIQTWDAVKRSEQILHSGSQPGRISTGPGGTSCHSANARRCQS